MLGQDAEIKTMHPERKIGCGLNDDACKELLGQPDSGLLLSGSYMSMLIRDELGVTSLTPKRSRKRKSLSQRVEKCPSCPQMTLLRQVLGKPQSQTFWKWR